MNYKKIYDDLMSSRLLLKKERYIKRKNGEYFEGHHIIPKSKGGLGLSTRGLNNENIVYLTAREHFLAHWILWRIYRDRATALAFHKMISVNKFQERVNSSSAYEEARLAFSETNKGNQYGKGHKNVVSEKQKQAISEFMKGRWEGNKNPFYGKKHSIESKNKISEKAKSRDISSRPFYKGLRIVTKKGEIIGKFKNNFEVANFIGCAESNIRHVLSGKQLTAKGYNIQYF
jgi:hypothetical protein